MTVRGLLLTGLALLAALGALQGGAALLGNASLQQGLTVQAGRLAAVNAAASAKLAFERADRAAQDSKRAPDPASAHALADRFRAEAAKMRSALTSAAWLDPELQPLVGAATEWLRQTDTRLPASTAGEQTSLLREDLLDDRRDATQREIAAAVGRVLQSSATTWNDAARAAAAVQAAVLALVTLSFAGVVLLAVLLVRRVLRPLQTLTEATRHLAAGELDRPVEDTARNDEIGAVTRALEALRRGSLHARTVEATAAHERRATEVQIRYLAHHDPLTGLANRAMLHDCLLSGFEHARDAGQKLALFCIDLDGFKAVNDSRGHAAGDVLLREVGRRLRKTTRESDTVARVGGDEFVVVTQADARLQPDFAEKLGRRIVSVLADPFDIADGHQAFVTASVGIALFPDDGDGIDALLANADTAMYRVKREGRDGHAFFRAEMDAQAQLRRVLDQDLRVAAMQGGLSLAYQPQVELATGEIAGFEALLRWVHPQQGNIPPELFIPIAEATGSIVAIGAWVLREACAEAARWANPLRVAVNVSAIQFRQCDMAALVSETLAATGLAPARLELEITETVLIRDQSATLEALGRIRESGVSIAMDDFGTGYSSLSTLRAFPFDRIKVDRSFVKDLATSSEAAAIVHAVLGLARGLGLPVVAEGVETSGQLAVLRAANCAEVQGYLFGRPAPIGCFAGLTHPAVGAGDERARQHA